jgi:hypothetical protein
VKSPIEKSFCESKEKKENQQKSIKALIKIQSESFTQNMHFSIPETEQFTNGSSVFIVSETSD